MINKYLGAGILASTLIFTGQAIAEDYQDQGDLVDSSEAVRAFKDGTMKLDFRLRHENAKQDQLKTAKATTLRSQMSFTTAKDCDLQFGMALVDVSSFFGKKYNSGVTGLAQPSYSLVADPKGTGLTNLYLKYSGIQETTLTVGRQFINIENGRFIGKRDFRQFPQSFDAITVDNKSLQDVTATYSYIDHVNTTNASSRNVEGRRKLRSHLLNLNWDGSYYNAINALFLLNKD
ncbi:MAG: alginate export family protein, partial [Francisellaceae bacterium]|nr:alginate export family protein [Francisellaceae bacterium]